MEKVYTLAEVAENLRMTNRAVARIARKHGLCMVNGRTILLTSTDVEAIKDVLRCPSVSSRPTRPRYEGPLAPSMDELSVSLRKLTRRKSRKPSSPRR